MLANQIEVITNRPVISILLVLVGINYNGQKNNEGGVAALDSEELQ